jgi:methylmalonyl-CoA/ethylmalonyl-CoA epimerase
LSVQRGQGYVVDNIEATVERLAEQLGAGPFFLFENVPLENITSRDEPAEFVHHSAFGYCGGGPIELMEIVRLVPERIEGRFSGARPGVHHVAWAVPPASVEDLRRELEDRGLPEYLSAQLGEIDTTFHDAPPRWATTSRSTSTARDGCPDCAEREFGAHRQT